MDLKSNRYSVELIEFLNQSSLVLLNARKLGDTSRKLIWDMGTLFSEATIVM